ncbi:MAG: homocysteine S-methyltransferase family protein [Gemmatales bacterium]|nr:homocysteine S-methyltransferase family protein [Gemmatales bacterium]MDW8387028.1 homocysteine S-methyltransferase family protein [Gemmatales bacterium]
MNRLQQALTSQGVLLLDGGIGTELLRRGISADRPLELANLTCPETVIEVYCRYREAGAMAVTSNTFLARPTANPLRQLASFDWSACNREGIRLARQAAGPDGFVLASVGPPLPDVPLAEAVADALAQTKALLSNAPSVAPDGILLETQSDLHFVDGLLEAVGHDGAMTVPFLVSFTYRGDQGPPRLYPSGEPPEEAAKLALRHRDRIVALGVNCGREMGLEALLEVVRSYQRVADLPVLVRPNAGTPTETDHGPRWPVTPEVFADWAEQLVRAGARLIGGCCGTTPAHIAATYPRLTAQRLLKKL